MEKNEFKKLNSLPDLYLISLPKKTQDIPIIISIRAGLSFAPAGKKQLAHFLEHYLISRLAEGDAEYNGYTYSEQMEFFILAKKKNIEQKIENILKAVFIPDFNRPDIFKKEKSAIDSELRQSEGSAADEVHALSLKMRLTTDGYNQDDSKIESLNRIQLNDLETYYRQQFKSSNINIFVGAYQPDMEIEKTIKRALEKINFIEGEKSSFLSADYSDGLVAVKSNPSSSIHFVVDWPLEEKKLGFKQIVELDILRDYLIKGHESPLFQSLRYREGLVYDVEVHFSSYSEFNFLAVSTSAQRKNIEKIIELILLETEKVRNGEIDEKRLKLILSEDNKLVKEEWGANKVFFSWAQSDLLDFQKINTSEEIIAINKSITKETLQSVAQSVFQNSKMNVVLVGRNVEGLAETIRKKYKIDNRSD